MPCRHAPGPARATASEADRGTSSSRSAKVMASRARRSGIEFPIRPGRDRPGDTTRPSASWPRDYTGSRPATDPRAGGGLPAARRDHREPDACCRPGVRTAGRDRMDASILIVSYNTRDYTLRCLESVHRQARGVDHEVVVVDNASADGSAEAIAAAFPTVRLVVSSENLG